MNNNVIICALGKIVNSKKMIFIILYLLFGSFIFANGYAKESYVFIFISAIMRANYILIFIIPPFLLLIIECFNFFNSNKQLILRFGNRSVLFNHVIFTSLLLTIYYFLIVLLCMGVVTNLIIHTSTINTFYFEYNVSDLYVAVLSVIKLLLFMFLLMLLLLIFLYKIKNNKITIIVTLIIVMMVLGGQYIVSLEILDISKYVNYFSYTRDFRKNVVESLLFYILMLSTLSLIVRIIGINFKNVIETGDDE